MWDEIHHIMVIATINEPVTEMINNINEFRIDLSEAILAVFESSTWKSAIFCAAVSHGKNAGVTSLL